MMKRVTWFASGVVAGAVGSAYAAKKVKKKVETLKPVNVAKSAVAKAKGRAHDLADALREGRDAMHEKEVELKALRDGEFEETSIVPVKPGQVIVLKAVSPGDRRRA